jgi:hypothetical protein
MRAPVAGCGFAYWRFWRALRRDVVLNPARAEVLEVAGDIPPPGDGFFHPIQAIQRGGVAATIGGRGPWTAYRDTRTPGAGTPTQQPRALPQEQREKLEQLVVRFRSGLEETVTGMAAVQRGQRSGPVTRKGLGIRRRP